MCLNFGVTYVQRDYLMMKSKRKVVMKKPASSVEIRSSTSDILCAGCGLKMSPESLCPECEENVTAASSWGLDK